VRRLRLIRRPRRNIRVPRMLWMLRMARMVVFVWHWITPCEKETAEPTECYLNAQRLQYCSSLSQ
jgi:hypothetical protein